MDIARLMLEWLCRKAPGRSAPVLMWARKQSFAVEPLAYGSSPLPHEARHEGHKKSMLQIAMSSWKSSTGLDSNHVPTLPSTDTSTHRHCYDLLIEFKVSCGDFQENRARTWYALSRHDLQKLCKTVACNVELELSKCTSQQSCLSCLLQTKLRRMTLSNLFTEFTSICADIRNSNFIRCTL